MIEIGTSIGRYHILEQLGQGGMATVYKAYDTRLEREVALKIIRRNAFSPDILERVLKRFDREAKSLARLTHPNIVSIIDYGEYENSPYLVMPYLPGGTVKQFLGKPIAWEKAIELLLPIADALRYSHQKGIVHRDVKPANILITEGGQPMLTDFGIARLLENEDTQTLTGTGVGVGTPEYMSPEQGMGKEVDGRSDIYSLGVVLYELVTGHKPYTADTPMAIVLKQATEPLPNPRKYVPELPEKVEQVLFKALAKKPEDRYQRMGDFAVALEGLARSADQATGSRWQGKKSDNIAEGSDRGKANAPAEIAVEPPKTVDDLTIPPGKKAIPRFWKAAGIIAAVIGLSIWGIGRLPPSPDVAPAITAAPTQITVQPTAPATVTSTPLQPTEILPTPISIPTLDFSNLKFYETRTIAPVDQIVYSPDGNHFAAATTYGIYIFERATLIEIMKLDVGTSVWAVAYSPDGQILASGGNDKTVNLWNANTGELLKTLEGHIAGVSKIKFSLDGRLLVSDSAYDCLLWDIAAGNSLQYSKFCASDFSPSGRSYAINKWSKGIIEIWDIDNNGMHLRHAIADVTPAHQTLSGQSLFYLDENIVVMDTGNLWGDPKETLLHFVDTVSGSVLQSLRSYSDQPDLRQISPDKGTLLVIVQHYDSNFTRSIDLWNVESKTLIASISSQSLAMGFSPDGQLFAAGSTDGEKINFYNVETGEQIHSLDGYAQGVGGIVFSPDGLSFITWHHDHLIRLWANREN